MASILTSKSLESRRMRAIELLQSGWKQAEVARKLDVIEGSVSNWKKKWREQGKKSLRAQPHSGRPCKLTVEQRNELVGLLDQGAMESGFATNDRTCPRVKQLIQDRFEVTFHVDHLRTYV
ncbi:MAG: transposase [Mariniblastus sp.]